MTPLDYLPKAKAGLTPEQQLSLDDLLLGILAVCTLRVFNGRILSVNLPTGIWGEFLTSSGQPLPGTYGQLRAPPETALE